MLVQRRRRWTNIKRATDLPYGPCGTTWRIKILTCCMWQEYVTAVALRPLVQGECYTYKHLRGYSPAQRATSTFVLSRADQSITERADDMIQERLLEWQYLVHHSLTGAISVFPRTAVQRQTAVTAYLKSKQLLLFAFAWYDHDGSAYIFLASDQWRNGTKTL